MQSYKIRRILFFTIFIGALLAAGLAACSPAQETAAPATAPAPLTLVDGLGREVQLDGPAQKIVSIAPSNTEILFAIGAGEQVVGRDEFSDYPEQAQALANVGGGFGALDMETMVALKPDLILASQLTPPEQVEAIEKVGLKVYFLANPLDLEGMFENLGIAGQLTGRQAEARALVDQLKARVAALDDSLVDVQEKPLVFYQLDSTEVNAPWTAGPGSFIDTLISRAGGINLGEKLAGDYAQISLEQLLVENPGVIIVGDYTWGGVTAEDVMARPSWAGLEAVKQGRVYIFDDNLVSRPGPRLVDGLEALAALLHPDQFK